MKNITKYWFSALEFITTKPVILLPFVFTAFLEGLALEIIYFYPKRPLSFLINPIVVKFYGENFTHYPDNLVLLPNLFYSTQLFIYVTASIFLIAAAMYILKHAKADSAIKAGAVIKEAGSRYPAYLMYGIIMVALLFAVKKLDMMVLSWFFKWAVGFAPNTAPKLLPAVTTVFVFVSSIITQALFILVVPIMVLKNHSLWKSTLESVFLGLRHFPSMFVLILVPYTLLLPVLLLKGYSLRLMTMTFPEITLILAVVGVVLAIFADCFVVVSVAHLLFDKGKRLK